MYRSIPLVQNPALNKIKIYDASFGILKKRPQNTEFLKIYDEKQCAMKSNIKYI